MYEEASCVNQGTHQLPSRCTFVAAQVLSVAPLFCRSFDPASVTIGKQLGEGSFGVVFEGSIGDKRGAKQGGAGTRVILKKVKSKVLGAEEMRTSELYFNQRLQRTARGSCAEFLGTVQVDKYTQKGKLVEVSRLGRFRCGSMLRPSINSPAKAVARSW
jgi:hypothetical protein